MECTSRIDGQDRNGFPCRFRCGQCTGCRVLRQSGWMLRNLMEYTRATSGQLLTLTIAPESYHPGLSSPKLIKNFFNALRMRDYRTYGSSPVRYFGCSEYGGTLGRLHYHFLIYNAWTHFCMDQGLFHTRLWPHGHCHLGSFQKASVRYVTEYLMERDWEGAMPRPFLSRRPGIGFSSLQALGAALVPMRPTISEVPSALILGQRTYPLDRTSRGYLLSGFLKAGGVFEMPTAETLRQRRLERLLIEEQRTPQEDLRAMRYRIETEAKQEAKHREQAEKFQQVYEKARRSSVQRFKDDPDGESFISGPAVEVDPGAYAFPERTEPLYGSYDTPF